MPLPQFRDRKGKRGRQAQLVRRVTLVRKVRRVSLGLPVRLVLLGLQVRKAPRVLKVTRV